MTVATRTLDYAVGERPHQGFFACDDAHGEPVPGVLLVHEWWGLNDFARARTRELAAAGYAVFAADMYGHGQSADSPAAAQSLMGEAIADFDTLAARFNAGLQVLRDCPEVDVSRLAAQGYCFGGAVVLNMARAGTDLAGVVSLHGSLRALISPVPGPKIPPMQVYTGGNDSLIPSADVAGFVEEMQAAGAHLELTSFPGVRHSFTNPEADALARYHGVPLGYDAGASAQAHHGALAFYRRLFSDHPPD